MGAENVVVIKKRNQKNVDTDAVRESVKNIIADMLRLILLEPHSVEIMVGEKTTVFSIDLQQPDFGRLLGAQGRTIQGIRVMTAVICSTNGFRGIVAIKNEDRFY